MLIDITEQQKVVHMAREIQNQNDDISWSEAIRIAEKWIKEK